MSRVDHSMSIGHVIDLVYEDRAFLRQLVYNVPVMDNFTPNIDWRAEGLESDFDDIDGANDAGTKTTWFQQKHPLLAGGIRSSCTVGDGIERSRSHSTIISIQRICAVDRAVLPPIHLPPSGP
jgi:hypothetical protein